MDTLRAHELRQDALKGTAARLYGLTVAVEQTDDVFNLIPLKPSVLIDRFNIQGPEKGEQHRWGPTPGGSRFHFARQQAEQLRIQTNC